MSAARPIFVVGNRRSGTTLLRLMLASHPSIGIPPEAGFAVVLAWKYGRRTFRARQDLVPFLDELFALDNTQDWELDRVALTTDLAARLPCSFFDLVDAVYRHYLARKFPGKARWGDKTTGYQDYVAQLGRDFPGAQFVHIVRDGRAVAASYKGVPHLTNDVARVAREWTSSLRAIRRAGRTLGTGHYYELRYEDLVTNPETVLRELCAFLGEAYSSDMLRFAEKNRAETLEPTRHLAWKQKTLSSVDVDSLARWRSELSISEQRTFALIAGPDLTRSGYDGGEPSSSAFERARVELGTIRYGLRSTALRHYRPLKRALTNILGR